MTVLLLADLYQTQSFCLLLNKFGCRLQIFWNKVIVMKTNMFFYRKLFLIENLLIYTNL